MSAFGLCGVLTRSGPGHPALSSCRVLAPGLGVAEAVRSRRCGHGNWTMITKRQRRLRKEAKRKEQEAKDEVVFLKIDEVVHDLVKGKMDNIVERMEEISQEEYLNEPMCNYLTNALAKNVPPPKGLILIRKVLLEQARREIPYRTATYNTMIRSCCLQKSYEDAVWWYQRMEEVGTKRDMNTYNQMILAAALEGDIEFMEQVYNEMRSSDKRGSVTTFNNLIKAYDLKNDLRGVRGAYRRLKENGVVPNWLTYDALIRIYGRNGEFDLVESVLKEMERNDQPPDARVFCRIITLCAQTGDTKAVSWWLNRMLEQRLHSRSAILTMMVEAFVLAKDMDGAETIVREMSKWNVRPNLQVLNALMDGYASKNDVMNAKRVLVRMQEERILPDVWTFNTLIEVLGRDGDVKGAELVLAGMIRKGVAPNMATFAKLTYLYQKYSMPEKILSAFQVMQRFEIVPTNNFFRACVAAMVSTGDYSLASGLIQRMGNSEDVINERSVAELLVSIVSSGMNPREVLHSLRKIGHPVHSGMFTAVLRYLCEHSTRKKAVELVQRVCLQKIDISEEVASLANDIKADLEQIVTYSFNTVDKDELVKLEPAGDQPEESEDEVEQDTATHVSMEEDLPDLMIENDPSFRRNMDEEDTDLPDFGGRGVLVEDVDSDSIQDEVSVALYAAFEAVLREEGNFEVSAPKNVIPLSQDEMEAKRQPYTMHQKEQKGSKLDFTILPRKSELLEDAGK
mmetsp:Transcript_12393/g.37828  ORF Transcript_12393/g.37828 Transcript_12393/m.37828 type:complete len:738 (-) Transcript_12393:123-2336(-)|eukprot:CAMPEP_0198733098 /NCGR_PEP_ID=MMETSP1475-20131203/42743_1 /TAXON_ID= ORGANISM="Unidentified sp., Strain CCMP1999" /NCGR_SAMPLE_ID=MMETSP1475 /ASSEMBLY_ACC=CAM_ASM_001111 /LENGTH=737 /DNA_ID=CAMNT_0044496345 /DNA_START=38 /DNA_END=2251 /DNA_ORIENTATION=-